MSTSRGQQQGGGGGGGGGGDSAEALSNRQKEIIAATFRLIRDEEIFDPEEYSDNIQAVAENQSTLAEQTQTLMGRLTARGLARDDQIARLTENLQLALEQMGPASQQLVDENLEEAQPFEQKSLQYLMRAEAVYNQIQVTQGRGGGGGGGRDGQNAEDLADLFDLELDQSKNQYETLQRGESQSGSQEMDEALRKLKELAQRQQRILEQQRQQALNGGGSGGTSQQMSAEEIRRETERLARQLDQLSRERNDPQMAQVSQALEQAARKMQQARNGSSQQQQQASEQALEQLERAERLLAGTQGGTMEERLAKLAAPGGRVGRRTAGDCGPDRSSRRRSPKRHRPADCADNRPETRGGRGPETASGRSRFDTGQSGEPGNLQKHPALRRTRSGPTA